jgi:hypothetical protein
MAVVPEAYLHPQGDTARSRRATTPRRDRATGNGELVIPFTVGPPTCVDRARLYVVSVRIYNVLAQPVGIPTLGSEEDAATAAPEAVGKPVSNLRLSCGRYAARWSGRHVTTGRRLAPGVYLAEIVIDGQRLTKKVTLDR